MGVDNAITLLELNNRVAQAIISSPLSTQNVWVTAELSDVSIRNHCYMELLQKDDNGRQVAKVRAVIWSGIFSRLKVKFETETHQRFDTGIKLKVCGSVNMHPVFGLSFVITDLDPTYTLGDLLRRRHEIVERLRREGILELNRQLEWPQLVQRVAVISAPNAAGYGDFMNQLMYNSQRLRFEPRLFAAVMQGEKAPQSIIESLNEIGSGEWDCVVIIRGGGATSDLQCFEDYHLASNIAQFPIPVIIGIGHERDITLLDYVANMRVKTPTAAAEWLIEHGERELDAVNDVAQTIFNIVGGIVASCKEQLSYYQGVLPVLPLDAVRRASLRLNNAAMLLSGIGSKHLVPARSRLDMMETNLTASALNAIQRARESMNSAEALVAALSPASVLKRGFSITKANGVVVTDASVLSPGEVIETMLASGVVRSIVGTE